MRMPRPKATGAFSHAYYHCISRVVEKRMHFGDREKKRLAEQLCFCKIG